MGATWLYDGSDGESHFSELDMPAVRGPGAAERCDQL